jgi:bacteriorhodopsin
MGSGCNSAALFTTASTRHTWMGPLDISFISSALPFTCLGVDLLLLLMLFLLMMFDDGDFRRSDTPLLMLPVISLFLFLDLLDLLLLLLDG